WSPISTLSSSTPTSPGTPSTGTWRRPRTRKRSRMGAQLRAVRRRIATVKSTAKITKAQELIASSRIIKAHQRAREAEPYARQITAAVEAVVSRSSNITHPLTTEPVNPTRAAVLILTSDRGFCGGFNSSVLREAQGLNTNLADRGIEPVPFVAGRKR